MAAVAAGAICLGSLTLNFRAECADDPMQMAYLKAIKPPAVRVVQGREAGEFFRDAERLRPELNRMKSR